MNTRIVSAVPDGELFENVRASVIRVDDEAFIPDFNPGPLDLALVQVQRGMLGKPRQNLDKLRRWLDWPPVKSRRLVGLWSRSRVAASDVAIAAIMNHPHSPFGIEYRWPEDVWPDAPTLVLYRGHTYERTGEWMRLCRFEDDH